MAKKKVVIFKNTGGGELVFDLTNHIVLYRIKLLNGKKQVNYSYPMRKPYTYKIVDREIDRSSTFINLLFQYLNISSWLNNPIEYVEAHFQIFHCGELIEEVVFPNFKDKEYYRLKYFIDRMN